LLENVTKERLLGGGPVVGCFVRSPDANLAEFVAHGPWDFLVFDGEHGSVTAADVPNLARACERRGVTPVVRVPSADPSTVLRCLDAGAGGIQFPWVNTREQAHAAVVATKYPPLGSRGLAGNRSTDFGVTPEAITHANDMTLVVVQIETRQAVENVEEICGVDGIDVVFIGPSDLSLSYGVPGDIGHPLVTEAIQQVAAAVRRSERVLGLFAGTPEAASHGLENGVRYLATGVESLLAGAMASFVRSVRKV
jgi:4-hydroxy-2-oxoheptanedioate aldolase